MITNLESTTCSHIGNVAESWDSMLGGYMPVTLWTVICDSWWTIKAWRLQGLKLGRIVDYSDATLDGWIKPVVPLSLTIRCGSTVV